DAGSSEEKLPVSGPIQPKSPPMYAVDPAVAIDTTAPVDGPDPPLTTHVDTGAGPAPDAVPPRVGINTRSRAATASQDPRDPLTPGSTVARVRSGVKARARLPNRTLTFAH